MRDAPDKIWFTQVGKDIVPKPVRCTEHDTEYRRADLPPTDAECLRNEKVRALVGLLKDARSDLACHIDHDYPEATRAQYPDIHRRWKRDMELCWKIDAALAALPEVKE